MKPKPREAREHLLRALAALEYPAEFCMQRGHEANDRASETAYVAGAARQCIEFALHALGEPIDPWREIGQKHTASPVQPASDQPSAEQS